MRPTLGQFGPALISIDDQVTAVEQFGQCIDLEHPGSRRGLTVTLGPEPTQSA